jgi:hypothetical protein
MSSCATIPPEFLSSMEKEKEGIALLNKRHIQTVNALVENWYNERVARISFVKQLEIEKITIKVNDPTTGNPITAIKNDPLRKIEEQSRQAIEEANKIKQVLIDGFSDQENWGKLSKINSINLEMTKSLKELNAAQRKLYAELVGQNTPFPSDFLNEESKKLVNKIK